MVSVSTLTLGALALAMQTASTATAAKLTTTELAMYNEWKNSSSCSEARKYVSLASTSSSGSSGIEEEEEQERFALALSAVAELQELHPYANFTVNSPFALLTADEFLAYVNRYSIDPDQSPIRDTSASSSSSGSAATVGSEDGGPLTVATEDSGSNTASSADGGPETSSAASGETVDWEDAGCVTAVKDQGDCGACWAFSATAAMESGYCAVVDGTLYSLSDQELISCDTSGESNGCGGGYSSYTMEWIADDRDGAMCSLASYPFASDDGSVPSCAMSSCDEIDIGVTGYESIREDAGALEDAVRQQPVSVFLYSGSSAFQYYSSGILTGDNCAKTGSHSALAVGFGEDDGVLYWRIKNQWGTSWGEDGYARIERRYSGDSEGACGVELYGSYPTFDGTAASEDSSATSAPTTEAPTTTTPTTEAPTTTAPTTEAPTTTAPTTETPVTETPVTETPTTDSPVATTETPEVVVQDSSVDQDDDSDEVQQDDDNDAVQQDDDSASVTTTPTPTCKM